ncbi:MAG: SDR family oxidoreductase [Microbacteriaceae bacterium]
MTRFSLRGSTVLITGGGSGIGRLMALDCARRGARIVIWDLDAASACRVATELRTAGYEASSQAVNVSDDAAVAAAARQVTKKFGGIDVLINNAGVVNGTSLLDGTTEGIRRTFDVNVLAHYWTTRAFIPGMLDRNRGRIVTIASASGLVGVSKLTDYSASKHAVVGFTESLRNELRGAGSRVTTLTVNPFYISTGLFDGVRTRVPWLLPILKPESVSASIVNAIESNTLVLNLPRLVGIVPVLRFLPTRAFDWTADLLGVNRTMDEFRGRANTPR